MRTDDISNRSRLVPLAATAALALITLSGCAVVDEIAHKQRSAEFPSASEMPEEWLDRAPWLPADARDIRAMESTVDEDAVSILVTSGSELSTDLCIEVPRQSAPTMEVPGAPDVYSANEVLACGDWSVLPAGDGWYGWTPNSADERSAAE